MDTIYYQDGTQARAHTDEWDEPSVVFMKGPNEEFRNVRVAFHRSSPGDVVLEGEPIPAEEVLPFIFFYCAEEAPDSVMFTRMVVSIAIELIGVDAVEIEGETVCHCGCGAAREVSIKACSNKVIPEKTFGVTIEDSKQLHQTYRATEGDSNPLSGNSEWNPRGATMH